MSELTENLKAELLDLNIELSESEQEIQEQKLIIERAEKILCPSTSCIPPRSVI